MCWGCAGGLCHFFVFSLICRRHFKKEVKLTVAHETKVQHRRPGSPSLTITLVAPNPPQIRCPVSWGVTDITAGPCLTNLDPLNPILRSIWVCGKSFMSNSKKPGYLGPDAFLPFLLRLLALGLDLCFLLASWEPRGHRWGGLYCGDSNWLVL